MSIERPARVRRSPEAARENILAACEAILLEKGPQALKLADVAAGAGVANATVLHHFGSIDGVQTALMARMIRQLVERIAVDFSQHQDAVGRVGAGARALFDAFGTRGGARLAAWLELTGEARRMTAIRQAVQEVSALRMQLDGPPDDAAVQDFMLVCISMALGVGLFGATLADLLGRPPERIREIALDLIEARIRQETGG